MKFKNANLGITLIELMVVLVIMAILGAIAFPAYNNYSNKARRAEGKSALNAIQLAQERFYTVNGQYVQGTTTDKFDQLDLDSNLLVVSNCDGTVGTGLTLILSENQNYCISASAATANSYTLTATAQGAQSNDVNCTTMTITHLGVKGGTAATGEDMECW